VDGEGLLADPSGLLRGEGGDGAQVVEPVAELDEHDPRVGREGEKQLAQVRRLVVRGARPGVYDGDLGAAVDDAGDVGSERAQDVVDGGVGVLDDVVE